MLVFLQAGEIRGTMTSVPIPSKSSPVCRRLTVTATVNICGDPGQKCVTHHLPSLNSNFVRKFLIWPFPTSSCWHDSSWLWDKPFYQPQNFCCRDQSLGSGAEEAEPRVTTSLARAIRVASRVEVGGFLEEEALNHAWQSRKDQSSSR